MNSIIEVDGSFFPALIERAKLYLLQMNFTLAQDSARQGFVMGNGHFEALRTLALILLLSTTDGPQRLKHLDELSNKLKEEAQSKFNVDRKLDAAKLFSRVCGYDEEILNITTQLASEVCDLEFDDWESRMEFARQLRRAEKYDDALSQYQLASNHYPGNAEAIEGMILCQALSGAIEEAKQQIEFLELVRDDESASVEMMFTQLLLTDKEKNAERTKIFQNLVTHFLDLIQNQSFDYSSFDLGVVLDVVTLFIGSHKCSSIEGVEDENTDLWKEICDLLLLVTRRYPSDNTVSALLAKVKFESNYRVQENKSSHSTVVSEGISSNALQNVIEAQIQFSVNDISGSRQSLEQALSQDFSIQRDHLYCLVKGSLHIIDVSFNGLVLPTHLYWYLPFLNVSIVPEGRSSSS